MMKTHFLSVSEHTIPSRWKPTMRRWLTLILCSLFLSFAGPTSAQEDPIKLRQPSEIGVLLAQLSMPDAFNPDVTRQELQYHLLRFSKTVEFLNALDKSQSELEQKLRVELEKLHDEAGIVTEKTKAETKLPLLSNESLDRLLQSCLLELQKIEWDEVVSSLPNEQDPIEERVRATKREESIMNLRSVETQYHLALENFVQLKTMYSDGLLPQQKLNDAEISIEKMRLDVDMARAKLEEAELNSQAQESKLVRQQAQTLKELTIRKESIQKQVARLEMQQVFAQEFQVRMSEKERMNSQLNALSLMRMETQNRLMELNIAIPMIEEALKKSETTKP